MTSDPAPRIRWAPFVPADRLIRLYEQDAAGLVDDELLDDVGWRLWERLSDVRRVVAGRVRCPVCGADVQVRAEGRGLDEPAACGGCDWSVTPREWHASWEHRDLNGHAPAFERFVAGWPKARSRRDRMLLIDATVHALHVASRDDAPGNFAARNFLEGSRPKVVAVLDALASNPGSTVAAEARARWRAAREQYRDRYRR